MDTKDIILELRTMRGLSQEELAEKVFVTRQAVSRWENGDTTPNTETLKLLSKLSLAITENDHHIRSYTTGKNRVGTKQIAVLININGIELLAGTIVIPENLRNALRSLCLNLIAKLNSQIIF